MKLSKTLIKKLQKDQAFRLGAAAALGIGERQIQNLIAANAENGNLTKIAVVDYFKANKFSDTEIFEKQKVTKVI